MANPLVDCCQARRWRDIEHMLIAPLRDRSAHRSQGSITSLGVRHQGTQPRLRTTDEPAVRAAALEVRRLRTVDVRRRICRSQR